MAAAPGMNSLVTGDDPDAGFWPKAGPVLTQGAGAIIGGMVAKKAQQGALQRSPEEAAALKGAMGSAGSLGKQGTSMMQEARPYVSQPASYYQTLLHGNRGAMAQATAAPRAALNDQYRGAQQNITQRGVRGAARDQQMGDLNRQRAAGVSALTTGVQPYAADQLSKLGTQMQATAAPMAGQAGTIYANLLDQGAKNRAAALQEGANTGKPIGQLIADLGKVAFAPKQPKKAPTPYETVGPPEPPWTAPPQDPARNGPEFPPEEQPYDYVGSGDYGKAYDPATYGQGTPNYYD
jgi:hypothetical protein